MVEFGSTTQSERGLRAGFNAMHMKDDIRKAELSDSCYASALFGKKNVLWAKKSKIKIG